MYVCLHDDGAFVFAPVMNAADSPGLIIDCMAQAASN